MTTFKPDTTASKEQKEGGKKNAFQERNIH